MTARVPVPVTGRVPCPHHERGPRVLRRLLTITDLAAGASLIVPRETEGIPGSRSSQGHIQLNTIIVRSVSWR